MVRQLERPLIILSWTHVCMRYNNQMGTRHHLLIIQLQQIIFLKLMVRGTYTSYLKISLIAEIIDQRSSSKMILSQQKMGTSAIGRRRRVGKSLYIGRMVA